MAYKSPSEKRTPWTFDKWDDGNIDGGRMKVYRPDYPRAKRGTGYASRAHIVWWFTTGQSVPKGFVLHHINYDSLDDRFENLRLMTNEDHTALHATVPCIELICKQCNLIFYVKPHDGGMKFCSQRCRIDYSVSHSKSPVIACQFCGAMFKVKPYRADTRKYCSHECARAQRRNK